MHGPASKTILATAAHQTGTVCMGMATPYSYIVRIISDTIKLARDDQTIQSICPAAFTRDDMLCNMGRHGFGMIGPRRT